eukprot:403345358
MELNPRNIKQLKVNLKDDSQISLTYLTISNREALISIANDNQQVNINETDLISGLYEGGLKIWDCSIDLVNYIAKNPELVKGKNVIELGCGQGLPGIICATHGQAKNLILQDYNQDVLENATQKALDINLQNFGSQTQIELLPGSWEHLLNTRQDLQGKFDIVLMSETLYNTQYYDSLFGFIDSILTQNQESFVLIGTKTFYFGLGGGYYEFQKYIEEKWSSKFKVEVIEKLNDMKSIERLILKMRRVSDMDIVTKDLEFKAQIQGGNSSQSQNDFFLQF